MLPHERERFVLGKVTDDDQDGVGRAQVRLRIGLECLLVDRGDTGGVTELLPRLVGLQRAREMILLGEKFDAGQAKDWGLLRDVVADDALMPQATDLARRLAALPRDRVSDLRRILARRDGAGLASAMAAETAATSIDSWIAAMASRVVSSRILRGIPRKQ